MRLSTPRAYSLLALLVLLVVAVPTLVASYRHASDVVRGVGDPTMAPWLPASIVGLLTASLGVIWLRRRADQPVGAGPWAAFALAMLMVVGANVAAVDQESISAYAVALFPPGALAITLELAAAVTLRHARHHHGQAPSTGGAEREPEPAEPTPRDRHPTTSTQPDHTTGQIGSDHDDSVRSPVTDRDADLRPAHSQPADPPRQLPPDTGKDDPEGGGADIAAPRDDARPPAMAQPTIAVGQASATEVDLVEDVVDTAGTDRAQPTDRTASAAGTPQPLDEQTTVPPSPPPSAARSARGAAKPPARAKRTATQRPTSTSATATTDVPARASVRTRPAREARPTSKSVAAEPDVREEPASAG